MPKMSAYRFGDLVLVPFAFTDQTGIKKRPAIVVSSDACQRQRPDVVLMAVTSQLLRPAGAVGEVLITEWQKAGLPKASLIKPVLTPSRSGRSCESSANCRSRTGRPCAKPSLPSSARRGAVGSHHGRLLRAPRPPRAEVLAAVVRDGDGVLVPDTQLARDVDPRLG
jgi:mRNA interferase MazF